MKQLLSKILAPLIIYSASATSLMATEETFPNEPYQPMTHTTYLSYEINQFGQSIPAAGYRYQKDKFILDLSVGYKYINFKSGSFGITSMSSNALYSFLSQEKSQSYIGVGVATNIVTPYGAYSSNKYIIFPSITVGHEFMLDKNRKLFIDLIYRSCSFGNLYSGKTRGNSLKIGIGF